MWVIKNAQWWGELILRCSGCDGTMLVLAPGRRTDKSTSCSCRWCCGTTGEEPREKGVSAVWACVQGWRRGRARGYAWKKKVYGNEREETIRIERDRARQKVVEKELRVGTVIYQAQIGITVGRVCTTAKVLSQLGEAMLRGTWKPRENQKCLLKNKTSPIF